MWIGTAQQQELSMGPSTPSRVLQSPPVQDGSPAATFLPISAF